MASNKIRTVLGDVKPEDVGMTLTHEHLSMTFDVRYLPPVAHDMGKEETAFFMSNLGWIRQNPYSHKENLQLVEENDAVIEEMRLFKENGGSCIVENTTKGIHRNLPFLKQVSETTGVQIVAGSGYYVGPSHPNDMDTSSIEDICTEMVADITTGCDDTDIRCGVIGEIGCSKPLTNNERKVLQAAACAQKQTGCPVIIHPGRHQSSPAEVIRVLTEAGGNIGKTVMSHLDRTILDCGELSEFAALGSYCEFDLFGVETSHFQNSDIDMPSDAQRIQFIKHLVQEGYEDKIVIAHDVHTKHRLMKYGGHGYSHILINILPKMRKRGISDDVIDKIMVRNPREWLQF